MIIKIYVKFCDSIEDGRMNMCIGYLCGGGVLCIREICLKKCSGFLGGEFFR